ncbi:MAG: outer membrane beta-barrel protein [Candidatus Symbiothrix sp.]|nr:outer membrane beta-barrel protein [Candidatus Symbiothrix sp.]
MIGILALFLFGTATVFGQTTRTISGSILDKETEEPVIAGSVELLKSSKDSTLVAGSVSDAKGRFSLKMPSTAGAYIIRVKYVGYKTFLKNINVKIDQSMNVGKLYLETDAIMLKEMVVEGKKPEVVVKNDTIEYDATAFKVPENAVVEDLIKKLPGAEVDKDGKITVNGKEVKKFKVDGKDFFSDDPTIASKNLPVDMIEKLQVIDEKSDMARMTGFDDGEENTIINLTIREGMKRGTMGNALAGLGRDINEDTDLRYQGGAFLNHMNNNTRYTLMLNSNNNNNMGAGDLGANRFGGMRMRRGGGGGVATSNVVMLNMNKEFSPTFNFNGDLRFNGSDRVSTSGSERVTHYTDYGTKSITNSTNNYTSNNIAANFNLEWKPDTMNTLIFRPTFGVNFSHSDETESADRYDLDLDDIISDTIFRSHSTAYNEGVGYNVGGSLDYAHKFSKPGRVFSVNLNGSLNTSTSMERSNTIYDYPDQSVPQKNYYNRKEQDETKDWSSSYRATLSFVEPLWTNVFLQATYRISYSNTESVNSTFDLSNTGHGYIEVPRVDSLSRSTLRNAFSQRIGLSLKFVRPKYNYTIGLNYDPSHSVNNTYQPYANDLLLAPYDQNKSLASYNVRDITKDSLYQSITQTVNNWSPTLNFNYIFGQRSNLRINYDGETGQPSASQLRDYVDKTRPTNYVVGNPNLKPSYSNNLRVRFQKFIPETQLMYSFELNGGFSVNDISSMTARDAEKIQYTFYDNVNGNWNTSFRGMFNLPLKNKKFTISSSINLSQRNQNSYILNNFDPNDLDDLTDVKLDKTESTTITYNVGDNTRFGFRTDWIDVGLSASGNFQDISYTVRPDDNKQTFNLGLGGDISFYLPRNWTIETDINYTRRSGSFDEYNVPETMWNASITKQLFSKRYGTGSLKLSVYDILQSRSSISASATNNGYQITTANVIPSFFMCSFIYKFTAFPTNSRGSGNSEEGGRRWGGGPPEGGGMRGAGGGPGGPGGGMW